MSVYYKFQRNKSWMHRPRFDWDKAELRHKPNTVENRIFHAVKKMISVRKEVATFTDFNNRELRDNGNPHLFAFCRVNHAAHPVV